MKKILTFLLLVLAVPAFGQYTTRIGTSPTNGTNEIQRITFNVTMSEGTYFQLGWNGRATSNILWMDTNDALLDTNIQHALIQIFGAGNTATVIGTLSSGVGYVNVTFSGAYAKKPVGGTITVPSNGTGGVIAVTKPTAGVLASYRSAIPGAHLIETDVPTEFMNTSLTQFSPVWAKLSTTTGFITALETKDTSTTGQSLVGTQLQFAIPASQTWAFEIVVFDSSSISTGLKAGFAIPTSATIASYGRGQTTGVTAFTSDVILAGATAGVAFSTVATGATYSGYVANGTVTSSTTAGNVIFEFLKATSGTAIIKAGSYLIAWRIA